MVRIFSLIIKLGLWAVPLLPLFVQSSLPSPFVTGKNFAFRVLIELLFALWAGLTLAHAEFRPQLTPLFGAVTWFVAVVLLADLVSPNPYNALFSNFERMEGFIALGHLYLYFVMLQSMFRTSRDWFIYLHITLAVSLIVSSVALCQKLGLLVPPAGGSTVTGTIGNRTYLGAYLLFHVWLLAILVYEFRARRWLCLGYLMALLLELSIIYFTTSRGVILALFATTILLLAYYIATVRNACRPDGARSRRWAAVALAALLLLPFFFWQNRDSDFVRSSPILVRFASMTMQDANVKYRVYLWPIAWKGAMERPLLGWGQENFYLVFQKYLDLRLQAPEPWFDRAHNIVLDWLVQAGLLGLMSYLAVLLAAIWSLAQGLREGVLPPWRGIALCALFVAHFLQNLFLFDNLNNSLLFFAALAYTDTLRQSPQATPAPPVESPHPPFAPEYAVGIPLLLAALPIYWLNVTPLYQATAFTEARGLYPQQTDMGRLTGAFRLALSYDAFGTTEIREYMAALAQTAAADTRVPPEEQKRFVEFTVEELRKERDRPAKNVRQLIVLGAVLTRTGHLNPSYYPEAEQVLQEAVRLSPFMRLAHQGLAQLYLSTGELEKALEASRRAWELDKNSREAAVTLWTLAIYAKRPDVVAEVRTSLDLRTLGEESLYRLGVAYQLTDAFAPGLDIYDRLVTLKPENPDYRVARSTLLARLGRIEEARREAQQAIRLNPALEQEAREFFNTLGTPSAPFSP